MNILVTGGTQFLGRHIVMAAIGRGHTVTLFNRGKTNTHLFPDLEKLVGDRKEGDLSALSGRQFDAVIDPSAYIPRAVDQLLETVETTHYTFISTISVYATDAEPNQDETAAVATLPDPTTEEITGETYGGLKVLCEAAANKHPNTLTVRSGLIVGSYDPTYRFEYYVQRIKQGGVMIAPPADYLMQAIDVRDQAEWIIRSVEASLTGVYNVTGHPAPMGEWLNAVKTLSGSDATFVHVDGETAATHDIKPWQHLPLWLPGDDYLGFHQYSIEKAIAAGMTLRTLPDTIQAILDWADADDYVPPPPEKITTLSAEDEAAVIGKLF